MQHAWFPPTVESFRVWEGFRGFGPVGFDALVLGSVSLRRKDVIVMLSRILSFRHLRIVHDLRGAKK